MFMIPDYQFFPNRHAFRQHDPPAFLQVAFRGSGYLYLPGYNHSVLPLTGMHVYRWLHEIHKPYFEDYVLNAIKIKNSDVLQYDIEEKGPEILSNSAEILQPGDYCWTPQDPAIELSALPDITPCGLKDWVTATTALLDNDVKRGMYDPERLLSSLEIPSEIHNDVVKRDTGCFFTRKLSGDKDFITSWIFPPVSGFKTCVGVVYKDWDPAPFMTANNSIRMCSDLHEPFEENAFGVDIDDNCRIIVFDPAKIKGITLPSHLPAESLAYVQDELVADDSAASPIRLRDFLRHHFVWCLRLHFLGGDISEDYDRQKVQGMINKVLKFDQAGKSLDDLKSLKAWQSGLGAEVLKHHIAWRTSIAVKNSEEIYIDMEDSEEEEEDEENSE
ncbi:uncharacterized protein STEHIDRAFT_153291 [Stereum hirsutum FP-91666 SS1]|uniref:uncharacterized protein n=1 Tax=Stereum hirsutum (strain FP-91666) TaxID=721885 RepID=UPI000440F4A9|nr:uncharacterized protein STEHIDRAFT_153291 [Stereum hirsutum FP-91666 SS1]EIM91668.1 hypothetical protein STEHIDRAFT_153291 [Stereum hirsutum FP-91666 SS1]